MLTVLAYSMVIAFIALNMTERVSAMIALILVPIAFAIVGGFGSSKAIWNCAENHRTRVAARPANASTRSSGCSELRFDECGGCGV
jgi:Mg2+/citrate symporter